MDGWCCLVAQMGRMGDVMTADASKRAESMHVWGAVGPFSTPLAHHFFGCCCNSCFKW